MSKKTTPPASPVQPPAPMERPFLLYAGDDEMVHVRVLIQGETLWLPLAQIAELFGVQTPGISKHLKNIFEGGELDGEAFVSKMETVHNLGEPEIKRLERTISGFFDYIEKNIIENRVRMAMADMAQAVDKFLTFNEYRLLTDKGSISKAQAADKALAEYAEFNRTQKIESAFDRVVKVAQVLEQGKLKGKVRRNKK